MRKLESASKETFRLRRSILRFSPSLNEDDKRAKSREC